MLELPLRRWWPISLTKAALFAAVVLPPAATAAELFAFDNGVGRGAWTPERQATALAELGYDGISYNYTNPTDLKVWLAELGKRKLKLHGLYLGVKFSPEPALPPGLAEALPLLRGTGAVVWLTVGAGAKPGDHDAEAITRIQETVDLAAKSGLRVVLYPHKGFYVATAEKALALAERCGRADLGVTVNLCHELASGHGPRLAQVIRRVAPRLAMVSINGATDRPGPGWDNYIKLLGEGDYDVAAILRTLREVRYRGPIGVQFYNVKGDSLANLTTTMRAWKTLSTSAP
ncbi:MAG: TIM barrel protein [Verrucomicrobia bacterium]|nr:TIM barrel protein [Verrucomicrobiota bacterium]